MDISAQTTTASPVEASGTPPPPAQIPSASSNDLPPLPPSGQQESSQPSEYNQHIYFLGAIVAFAALLILGGIYGYFVMWKPKPVQVQSQQQNYQNPFTSTQESIQEEQQVQTVQAQQTEAEQYENPFDVTASSEVEVSDNEYQNPF